jgi:hypothetical protein
MRNPGGDTADRRQALARGDLPRQPIGTLAGLDNPASRLVERRHDAVELALAGGLPYRELCDVLRLKRSFDLCDVT